MRIVLLTVFIMFTTICFACLDSTTPRPASRFDHDLSVLTGFRYYKRPGIEIGLGYKKNGTAGYHPATLVVYVSSDFFFDKTLFIGPRFGFWLGGGVAGLMIGLNATYYTNLDTATLRLQPEIGMGFGSFRIYYARNYGLTNKNYDRMGGHLFGLNLLFDIKRIKTVPTQK